MRPLFNILWYDWPPTGGRAGKVICLLVQFQSPTSCGDRTKYQHVHHTRPTGLLQNDEFSTKYASFFPKFWIFFWIEYKLAFFFCLKRFHRIRHVWGDLRPPDSQFQIKTNRLNQWQQSMQSWIIPQLMMSWWHSNVLWRKSGIQHYFHAVRFLPSAHALFGLP